MDSFTRNIEIIQQNQAPSGAYIASPAFPNYHYCWLRDGSFIAHAMDVSGNPQSARAFFRWLGKTIQRYAYKVDEIQKKVIAGQKVEGRDVLNTRFTLDGYEERHDSEWGNFQIDGYGTWLWALAEYVRKNGDLELVNELAAAINTTLRYLNLVWQLPNYDCWEEHPEYIHPSTLAAVYAGFKAADWLHKDGWIQTIAVDAAASAEMVKEFILEHAIVDGKLIKHIHPAEGSLPARPVSESGVDASLMGMFVPYEVFPMDSEVAQTTLGAIEANLHRKDGGVYRFKTDVYYGGGEWLLLTAWLGWIKARQGQNGKASQLAAWIASHADHEGNLPEQVNDHSLFPEHTQPWIEKWGPVASPLLWSHAMALILAHELKE